MKKNYILFLFLSLLSSLSYGQTTIATGLVASTSTTGTQITFAIENTNAAPILVTEIANYHTTGNNGATYTLWTSPLLTGTPTVTSPTWTQVATGPAITLSAAGLTPVLTGLTLIIPASTTLRVSLNMSLGSIMYNGTTSNPTVYSGGGVNILTGSNATCAGWVGAFPTPTITGRWFCGSITFMPASPCTSPPTPGTAVTSNATPCAGNIFGLNLTGSSFGTGQTYQWESATTTAGPWTNVGTSQNSANINVTATSSLYYRCAVTCGASMLTSVPVLVTVPGLFPGGTYTINSALATGGSNFQTFAAAANAIRCGVTGPITFNVAAGSGPYNNDRFALPHIASSSAINTITINGNGATLSYAAAGVPDKATVLLDGTDYVTFNNLTIVGTNTTNAFAVHLTNNADNNTFSGCTMNAGQNVTSATTGGIIVSGGDAATTADSKCDSNTFINNTIIGGYYGFSLVGNGTTTPVYNNKLVNNTIRDAYFYQTYMSGNNGTLVQGNDISRLNRTTISTFYGLYMVTCRNMRANANKIHDPCIAALTSTSAAYGIYNSGASVAGSENIISNNIVYNFSGYGSHYGIYNTGGGYYKYYYNTINFDFNASASTATYFTYGFYQVTAATALELRNNIIKVTRAGATNKYCIYFSTATATLTGDRNVYHMGATTGLNNLGFFAGVDQPTLASWKTATSQDANTIDTDPVFTAPATGNLLPTATAVNNIGLPITGVITDILNITRSATTPDPGAFESAPLCAMPTGLAATGITATSANTSWTAVSGATGYQYAVNTSATPPTGAGTAITGTSYNATLLIAGTTYYLHVRTACGANFSGWVTYSFTTLCTAPTGLAAAGITAATANLSWNAITGVIGFEYAINASATPPASGTATTATTYNATGLTPATGYYLHVRTQCNATVFSAWTSIPFTTQSPLCPSPTGLTATGITTTGVTLNWNAAGTSTGYEYVINTIATPPASGNATAATTYTTNTLTPGTTYYAHVRNQCSPALFSIWTTVSFTTPYPPCDAPTVALSNITVSGVTISWGAVTGAVGYQYAVDASATPPTSGATTTNTSEAIAGLIDNTPYFVHMRTNCGPAGFSSWVTVPFATAAYCTAPTAIISNLTASRVDVNWNAMSSALSYEYAISTSVMPPSTGTGTSGLNHNADQLLPDTKYYIHLMSVCATERSNWTTSGFTTQSPAGIKDAANAVAISVYPNPVRNMLTVRINSTAAKGSELQLTDVTGKKIRSYASVYDKMEIDMSGLSQGVYMLKYISDNGNNTIKIIKD